MLGIIIGISSVILIISLGEGATRAIANELSSFGTDFFAVNPGSFEDASAFTGSVETLTRDDGYAIVNEIPNVIRVSPLGNTNKIVTFDGEEERLMIAGVTVHYFELIKPNLVYGRYFTQEDDLGFSRIAVIGKNASETFFGNDTDPTDEIIRVDGKPFRIVGVIESTSTFGSIFNDAVFIPLDVMNKLLRGATYLQEMHVQVENVDLINQTIEDVKVLLRDRHKISEGEDDDFSVSSFQDALSTLETITGLLTSMVAAVSGISLLVGGIGIMNIMLVTITERTKEIGLLKAIGAKRKDILIQFLIESVVMTLVGGVIGIVIGVFAALGVSGVIGIPFVINPFAIVVSVGVSTAVGIIFGIYPARRAAKLDPIDALRHE